MRGKMAAAENLLIEATTSTSNKNSSDEYDYEYIDEVCDRGSTVQFGATLTPVVFSCVVILSLFGNILVIVILAKYENLRSLTNTFIMNLAVSDLFFTACLPFWAYYHMYGWTLGEPACKVVTFVFYVGFYSSGILLIMMTAHRYVAVMDPLSDIVSTKGFYSVLASVVIWAFGVLAAIPASIFTKVLDKNRCENVDSYWTLWGIYQQNIFFILSSVIFIFCYSQIMCRLLRPTAQRRKNKTLKLIFTLMVVFFMGWGPYNIVIFLQSLYFWSQSQPPADSDDVVRNCGILKLLDYAFYISRLFAFSHCCLNPVFYVFVGVKFKNHLERMLKSWGGNNNSIRSRRSRLTITSLTSGEEFSLYMTETAKARP